MTKFIGFIPARYGSTRFPAKPLANLAGKTIIRRVYENVKDLLDEVIVATDDQRIYDEVKSFSGNVIMTSPDHQSGTDRCYEAFKKSLSDSDVIINIQGDEPFIHSSQIESLKRCFDDSATDIATLVKPFAKSDGWEKLSNPNSPKVILNKNSEAVYFSRSVIPFIRNYPQAEWLDHFTFYKHIGIYAYRADVLEKITRLPQSPLEIAESLEQLRWIDNGLTIKAGITNIETIGIDTPEDLENAIQFYLQNNK